MNLFSRKTESLALRDYQERAVNMAREAIARNKKIVLQLPCGAGKTIMGAHMISEARKKGLTCAFIVDRIALLDQTSAVFGKYGISHGVIQANHPMYNPHEKVQVCSIATIRSRRIKKQYDLILIDECHCLSKEHERMIEDTKFVVGLSATPWRKGLGRHFNELVAPISVRDLISGGHLVDYRVYAPSTIDMTGARTVAGDYAKKDIEERADQAKITGDIVTHWLKYGENRKTICFCVNIAHGRHVAREFNKRGVRAVEVNSYQDNEGEESERKMVMREFVEGDAQVICSVNILGTGFDFPGVSCAILARPTKSPMVHVQQVGRALRVGGEADALILDHAGNFPRLGFIDDMPDYDLDGSEHKKGNRKEKEAEPKLPKPCVSCDFLKPVGVKICPACLFEPENVQDVETEDGELVELKRKKVARKEYTMAEKQDFLAGLNTYAKKRGMSQHAKGFFGWACHKYKEKFGSWPANRIDWALQGDISQDVENFITHMNIRYARSK